MKWFYMNGSDSGFMMFASFTFRWYRFNAPGQFVMLENVGVRHDFDVSNIIYVIELFFKLRGSHILSKSRLITYDLT